MNPFQKTPTEKVELRIYKQINKRERKKEFGLDYKKHLNPSEKKIDTIVFTT